MVKEADLKSAGRSPRRFKSCRCRKLSVAQLVERQTVEVNCHLLVAGSIPAAEKFLKEIRIAFFGGKHAAAKTK